MSTSEFQNQSYAKFLAMAAGDIKDRNSQDSTRALLRVMGLSLDGVELVCGLIYAESEPTKSLAELCVAVGRRPQTLAIAIAYGLTREIDWGYLNEALSEYFSPTPCNLSLTLDVQQIDGRTEIDVDPLTGLVLNDLNAALEAELRMDSWRRLWRETKIQYRYRGQWAKYFNAIQEQPRLRADQPFLERLFQFEPRAIGLLNTDEIKQLSVAQYRNLLSAAQSAQLNQTAALETAKVGKNLVDV